MHSVIRKAVGIIILYKNREILLAKRGDKEERMPGLWENVGGEVEKDESWESAVVRELCEEIGESNLRHLNIGRKSVLEWIDKSDVKKGDDWKSRIYIADANKKFEVEIDRDEDGYLDEIRWFKISNLPWDKLTSYCKKDYEKLGKDGVDPFVDLVN